ncbi:MAG: hypothetical protein K2N63_02745 [Lachnospiraceae bacterium]|nr:hypothetical protein [Lachnospiraceae bacterium]
MDHPVKTMPSRRLRRYFMYLVLFSVLFLMLLFPETAARGALDGLLLWSKTLLPILLPFLILSGLLINLHMTRPFELLLGPVFTHIFPIRAGACYPLFLGLLCGMPLGAKTTASLYRTGRISERESMFLLGFSNQASMMFLVSYVATQQQSAPHCALLVLLVLYSSAWLSTTLFILPRKYGTRQEGKATPTGFLPDGAQRTAQGSNPPFFAALDALIPESFATITKVGGYVILFSMLSAFTRKLPLSTPLSALVCGLLEITSGIQQISASALPAAQKTALTLGVTAFGGFCGLMQTKSVTSGTGLSIHYYAFVKLMQGIFAYLLTRIIFTFI